MRFRGQNRGFGNQRIVGSISRGVSPRIFPKEANVERGLRLQTRRAFLRQVIPQYRKAKTVKKKSKLLDAFTTATGYNRQYAM